MTRLRILGIDPGSVKTGYAVIDYASQRFSHVHSGYLALGKGAMASRLGLLYRQLATLIEQYQPDDAAVESVFMQKNVASAIKLGQARGAILAALACGELQVDEYSPAKVKQTICGSGRADKGQVQFMVQRLIRLPDPPQEDQADALAVAICHAFHRPAHTRIPGVAG